MTASNTRMTTQTPNAPALAVVEQSSRSKIASASGLAVIRDAWREADPRNRETWLRISPAEAIIVRDGFWAAQDLLAENAALREVARMVVEASDLAGLNGPLGEAARAALTLAQGGGK